MRKKAKKEIIKINNNQQVTNSYNYFPWLLKNVAAAVFIILLIIKIIVPRDCYYSMRQLRNDMNVFHNFPKSKTTLDDRSLLVFNQTYGYFQMLRDNTPEDAIILYPEYNDFFPANVETIFENDGISSKMWAIRFLYPRKVIKPSELGTSPYKDKITHVAIVNGHGYQYLHYKIEEHQFGVLPIDDATEEDMQTMDNKE